MKAILLEGFGGPECLSCGEAPDPAPGPGEVLVRVAAAGVNRADLLQRQGHYPPPTGASDILGLECAGTIAALGEGVVGWSVGDRVAALLAGGGYAEQVAVAAGQLLAIPDEMDFATAAAIPEATCTVVSNLFLTGGLAAGETMLIHGGASGIGTTAIQLAKAAGARVACTVGSPEKAALARRLGADLTIDHRAEDFVARIKEEGGADLILDIIGGRYLARNLDALRRGGRLVVIGLQGGRTGELDLGKLLMKQARVIGTSLRALPPARKAEIVAATRARLGPLIEQKRFAPVIDRTLPLAQAADAHRLLEQGGIAGKIVLTID